MHLPISITLTIAAPFVIIGILYLLRIYKRQNEHRPPLTRDRLRSPGQSLLPKLESINTDLMFYLLTALLVPLAIVSIHISISYFGGVPEGRLRSGVAVGVAIGFCVICIYKIIELRAKRRALRLGYEAKQAVGQELDRVIHAGFCVYHDFPADKFHIDHIVVGSKGVFTVETMERSRPISKNRVKDATVEYDGRMLYFPKGDDAKTVDQAQRRAAWLSDWLGNAIGEPIAARAIVALPEWFIKRSSSEGISVVNPQQFSSLFEHIKPRSLSESAITRINQQIEQKCRNVELDSKNDDD